MRWEFLGKQELPEGKPGERGYVYLVSMWRTPVPGGWLLMSLNSKSNGPQPVMSFYPDADHLWQGNTPPEADYLLRPASGSATTSPEHLLRAASEDNSELKRLEG